MTMQSTASGTAGPAQLADPARLSDAERRADPAQATDPALQVLAAVRTIDLALERMRITMARRHSIMVNDTLVLSRLAGAPDQRMRPVELTRQLQINSGTLTAMLDRLEAAHLVGRASNPNDRRSLLVELTAAGRQALEDNTVELVAAIRGALSNDDHAFVAPLLDTLAHAVASAAH